MEMTDFCADVPQSLRTRLAQSQPQHDPLYWRLAGQRVIDTDPRIRALLPAEPRAAAVLVPLVQGEQGPGILLTVRAAGLRHHANQISFPGGRIESGDADPAAAALREAQEEIGLQAVQTQVLGYLPDHVVFTGYRITPVVAWVGGALQLRHDPAEVADSFLLPLSVLLSGSHEVAAVRHLAGVQVPSRDIHYGDHRIWGATAGILMCLRQLLLDEELA